MNYFVAGAKRRGVLPTRRVHPQEESHLDGDQVEADAAGAQPLHLLADQPAEADFFIFIFIFYFFLFQAEVPLALQPLLLRQRRPALHHGLLRYAGSGRPPQLTVPEEQCKTSIMY